MSLATDILKRSGIAQLSLIDYLITGNRWDTRIFRRNRRDDNTSGDTNDYYRVRRKDNGL